MSGGGLMFGVDEGYSSRGGFEFPMGLGAKASGVLLWVDESFNELETIQGKIHL